MSGEGAVFFFFLFSAPHFLFCYFIFLFIYFICVYRSNLGKHSFMLYLN
jgi:hypothetical protein